MWPMFSFIHLQKAITILDGEFKGKSMGTYQSNKCKEIIDAVRKSIGCRTVSVKNIEKIREIVDRY